MNYNLVSINLIHLSLPIQRISPAGKAEWLAASLYAKYMADVLWLKVKRLQFMQLLVHPISLFVQADQVKTIQRFIFCKEP
jgi:hypothetical protein